MSAVTAPTPVSGIPATRILVGDVRDALATLSSQSVHCIVTSPPYYGLRDYGLPPSVWGGDPACSHEWGATQRASWANAVPGPNAGGKNASFRNHTKETGPFCAKCGAWRGCLGLEPTVELFLDNLVAVFRDCWRVLRDDGTLWLNIGDSYAGSGNGSNDYRPEGASISRHSGKYVGQKPRSSLASKQLLGIPWRVAFALQADGWVLRSDIVWSKPNCMPESVKDRPTKAHEYVFLLAKQGRYYYDADAVREETQGAGSGWLKTGLGRTYNDERNHNGQGASTLATVNSAGRNRRSVWTIPTTPFSARSVGIDNYDHFAVMPPKLVEPCVLAGTSERGVCPTCGAAWGRVTSKTLVLQPDVSAERNAFRGKGAAAEDTTGNVAQANWTGTPRGTNHTVTLGWQPSCQCDAGDPVPATVLDPFGGVMTTALVANQLGRDSISIELGPKYAAMGARRIQDDAGMLCDITIEEMP